MVVSAATSLTERGVPRRGVLSFLAVITVVVPAIPVVVPVAIGVTGHVGIPVVVPVAIAVTGNVAIPVVVPVAIAGTVAIAVTVEVACEVVLLCLPELLQRSFG